MDLDTALCTFHTVQRPMLMQSVLQYNVGLNVQVTQTVMARLELNLPTWRRRRRRSALCPPPSRQPRRSCPKNVLPALRKRRPHSTCACEPPVRLVVGRGVGGGSSDRAIQEAHPLRGHIAPASGLGRRGDQTVCLERSRETRGIAPQRRWLLRMQRQATEVRLTPCLGSGCRDARVMTTCLCFAGATRSLPRSGGGGGRQSVCHTLGVVLGGGAPWSSPGLVGNSAVVVTPSCPELLTGFTDFGAVMVPQHLYLGPAFW